MGVRNRSRKALLQARFAAEVNGRSILFNMETVRRLLEDVELGLGAPLDTDDWDWIAALGEAVESNRGSIQALISDSLQNWSLDRLNLTTRLILEQAVGEMMYIDPPTPPAVAMDEAVELARMFDTEEAAGLVNGVLDSLASEQGIR
jgi:transcription antitermination protein NusB